MEIEDEVLGDMLGGFYKFCQPRQDSDSEVHPPVIGNPDFVGKSTQPRPR
jgi:hypothetical protein